MNEEPLAEFAERRFWMRRKFRLFPGCLHIAGRQGGGTFAINVPLDNIRLPSSSIAFRDGVSQVLAVAPGGLLIVMAGLWGPAIASKSAVLFMSLFVLIILAMFVAPFFVKRTPYVQYYTTAGVAAFNIGKLGVSEVQWNDFVQRIEEEISRVSAVKSASTLRMA
jgi:hypothetical protein